MNKKRNKESLKDKIAQFVEYNIAGAAFFWSGYVVLLGLDYAGAPLWVSSSVSYTVGLTINFLLERYWVFKDNKDGSAAAVAGQRYLVISVLNLGLNYAILKSLELAGVPLAVAPFISSVIFTPWNFVWYKYWVFAGHGHNTPKKSRKAHINTKKVTKKR